MWYKSNRRPSLLIWVLSLSIITLITWSYFVEIQQVVRAQGKIIPTGKNKLVQHLEGGIIAEILIQEGDMVEKGQVMFRIKNEFAAAELNSLEIERISLLVRQYRLNAQLKNERKIAAPKWLVDKASKIVAGENKLLKDIYLNFVKQQQILRSVWQRKKFQIKELSTQKNNLKKELKLATKELGMNEKLLSKGAASGRDVLDSQKRYQSLKTSYDRIDLSIPTARSEAKEALSRLEQEKTNYQLKIQQELIKTKTNIAKVVARQKAFSDRQKRSEISSSVKGIVNKLMVNTIGGIIRPGDSLASITPLDSSLIVQAKVSESDRAEIWIGQPVKVKLRAYDYATYGSLDGEIILISADSFSDNVQQNQYYYQVHIKVQQNIGEDKPILPGMLSDVDMLTGKKSVLAYLTGPIIKSWDHALQEP